jgi:hypothetical protein
MSSPRAHKSSQCPLWVALGCTATGIETDRRAAIQSSNRRARIMRYDSAPRASADRIPAAARRAGRPSPSCWRQQSSMTWSPLAGLKDALERLSKAMRSIYLRPGIGARQTPRQGDPSRISTDAALPQVCCRRYIRQADSRVSGSATYRSGAFSRVHSVSHKGLGHHPRTNGGLEP